MTEIPAVLREREIRCILFDLGDTLWYREDQVVWARLEAQSNQRGTALLRRYIAPEKLPNLDDEALGRYLRKTFDEYVRSAIRSNPTMEPHGPAAVIEALRQWGIEGLDEHFGAQLFEALRVRIPESRPLFPDTLSTLAELAKRGFRLGVVTNRLWGGPPFHEDLQTMGLLNYFDLRHVIISGDLGIRKPNPDIFLCALETLDVKPEQTVMVGDSLSADVLGAQPLGIFSIWKPKSWLYEWVKVHTTPDHTSQDGHQASTQSEAFPGVDTADTQYTPETSDTLLPGMHATDDDYILALAAKSRDYLEQFQRGEIQPDLIIQNLSDLLEVFVRAGVS